jgi:hypothetical protein
VRLRIVIGYGGFLLIEVEGSDWFIVEDFEVEFNFLV